jgi:hypothetical protein
MADDGRGVADDAKDLVQGGTKLVEGAGRLAEGDVDPSAIMDTVQGAAQVAKPAFKIWMACCVVEAAIGLFVFLLIVGIIGGPGSSQDQATADTGGATAGATVPNTVTKLTVKGKTIQIPSTKGKTGAEQYLSGMTFSSQCNATEEKWYITMRWPYVKWGWDGTATYVDSATTRTKPDYATVRVVVYNPKTKKSVITAICESGPAPWTGSTWAANHGNSSSPTAPYWKGYYQFDPPQADGRVSGLAPDAFKAIGAKENDVLEYGFAQDQNATLGPVK